MELDTKVTFFSSMIPRLYLFLILALLSGGNIRFKVMWTLSAFLSAHVNRSYSKHGIRHQDQLHGINDTKVMRVFDFGNFGCRPPWKWLQKVPSWFFPPGILVDLITRPPEGYKNEGFKTIPIFFPGSAFKRASSLRLKEGRTNGETWQYLPVRSFASLNCFLV